MVESQRLLDSIAVKAFSAVETAERGWVGEAGSVVKGTKVFHVRL